MYTLMANEAVIKRRRAVSVGIIAIIAGSAQIAPSFADRVKSAEEALATLMVHYMRAEIYHPVRCDLKVINKVSYIACGPDDRSVPGGLFVYTDDGTILTVNGKAKSHTESVAGEIQAYSGTVYDVKDWQNVGEPADIDIQAIFAQF